MPEDKIPFSMKRKDGSDLPVQGKMRWPTTYTGKEPNTLYLCFGVAEDLSGLRAYQMFAFARFQ